MRNLDKKLQNKTWYRFYKVLTIFIIALSFLSPLFTQENTSDGLWLLDSIINVVIWTFIFMIILNVLIYIIYGGWSKIESDIKK